MLDDLRNDAAKQYEEESQALYKPAANTLASRRRSKRILGMTSFQRFVILFMLMFATCGLGFLCLFATGRIGF
ncbi:MAG: hypothetical protein HS100_02775 [Anaerolineales bacterium]|nr:MAG: hypothetical protein EDM79_08825 [Chloroflexota bacterium]MBE7432817.1 hypothetical protein [Anaerolineales bacterium]MCE7860034.1 hypothetical protein [Chloroflexi bacterium CFX2]MCK6583226.1 hypothetical protein [Anaerolineales bacterium]GJQ37462.1 MAG: hypothetical protein JETCAE01_34720 [Anaerolineaceae bacterium]